MNEPRIYCKHIERQTGKYRKKTRFHPFNGKYTHIPLTQLHKWKTRMAIFHGFYFSAVQLSEGYFFILSKITFFPYHYLGNTLIIIRILCSYLLLVLRKQSLK